MEKRAKRKEEKEVRERKKKLHEEKRKRVEEWKSRKGVCYTKDGLVYTDECQIAFETKSEVGQEKAREERIKEVPLNPWDDKESLICSPKLSEIIKKEPEDIHKILHTTIEEDEKEIFRYCDIDGNIVHEVKKLSRKERKKCIDKDFTKIRKGESVHFINPKNGRKTMCGHDSTIAGRSYSNTTADIDSVTCNLCKTRIKNLKKGLGATKNDKSI